MQYRNNNEQFPWKNLIIIIETVLLIVIIYKYVPIDEILKEIENKADIAALSVAPNSVFNEMTRADYEFLQIDKEYTERLNEESKEIDFYEKPDDIIIQRKIDNELRIKELEALQVNEEFNEYIILSKNLCELRNKLYKLMLEENRDNEKINNIISSSNKIKEKLALSFETALINMNVPYTKEDDGTIWYTVPSEYHIGMGK